MGLTMKRIVFIFLTAVILFSSISVPTFAQDADFIIQDGILVRYNGTGGYVVVPNNVVSIGAEAFASLASVTSITLPNSVITIETSAFSGCINLASINIPPSVFSIDDYAFAQCLSLSSITISDNVKKIGLAVFDRCENLITVEVDEKNLQYTSLSGILFNKDQSTLLLYPAGKLESSYTIPSTVTDIGANAFSSCYNLTSIIIPNSVKSIGENAFSFCENLISIKIPNSIKTIGKSAFSSCSNLTTIEIPDSVTRIGEFAFFGIGATSINLPPSIKRIPTQAFSFCKNLTSMTIPDGVTHIESSAFTGCSSLTSITISDSVVSIENSAFNLCPSLTSIIIPSSVKNIGNVVFYQSDNVTIYCTKDSYAQKYAQDNYIKYAEYTIQDDNTIVLDPSSVTQTAPDPADMTFDAARVLNKLGLFNGIGIDAQGKPVFELDRAPTRQEAVVMLLRLLGLEKNIYDKVSKNPFDDVDDWAAPYVGYAYSLGLTNGISQHEFGSDEIITLQQYCTFLLRALQYSEKDNDFTYDTALDKAFDIGIIQSTEDAPFNRGDAAQLSYNTLLLPPNNETNTLANILLWDDVFSTDQLDNTHDGKLMLAADMPDFISKGVLVYNLEDLHDLILLSERNYFSVEVTVPGFTGNELNAVFENIVKDFTKNSVKTIWGSNAEYWNNYISASIGLSDFLELEYYYENPSRYQKNYFFDEAEQKEIDEYSLYIPITGWVSKIDGIVQESTTPSMSQKEKVKALHDYLVLNTMYDFAAEGKLTTSSHFAQQILFEGYGVCDGYSEAFKILMNGAGIECNIVYGDTPYGLHAWNQVKIDGVWYNMDVTWDDPDDGEKISYDYFCISDEKFLEDHTPDKKSKLERCPRTLKLA